jgi:hypothetical protein
VKRSGPVRSAAASASSSTRGASPGRWGHDLLLEPRQAAGPVNANPKGYVEIDGAESAKFERKMTFREVK